MKKILLSLMTICAFVIVKAQSSTCSNAAVRRWTNETNINGLLPGSEAGTVAPITIDGSALDWVQYITGPFAYFNQPVPPAQPDPHTAPVAGGNVQVDALKGTAGELDRPGQNHRDLRYFAFTYDQKNVFFYFRRPDNNSAQVALYYFIDINVDGFMRTGEPVIKITYNGGQGTLSMAYFVENTGSNSGNGGAAGSWVSEKGNAMTAPVARAGTNNTSQWIVGSADGWAIPGSVVDVPNSDLPALQAGEFALGKGITDIYSDGATATGYGAEFAIPWSFFKLYGGYSYPGYTPLDYLKVFTWHVSLVGGNSGIDGAEDNAGGCCTGLAVSGSPDVSSSALFGANPVGVLPWDYRLTITYTDNKGVNTKVTTNQLVFKNPKDANGIDIPGANIALWQLTAFKDLNCNGDAAEGSVGLNFDAGSSEPNDNDGPGGDKFYVFNVSTPTSSIVIAPANLSACLYINIGTLNGGFPPIKSGTVSYSASTEFDIASTACSPVSIGGFSSEAATLPVKFTTFNAARSGQNVNLTWQTATEEKNSGFEIQRLIGGSGWQKIGYVPTQAANGNSTSALNYQFTDISNTTKGITQYRLMQVDIDHRGAYSVIRSVRGEGQKGKIIAYPNPSSDGKVNIMFEEGNVKRDVSLLDMSGRMIKQWKGVINNNIAIDNLNAGFYTVRIINTETGEQAVEKIVVNKR
jgi:hypothetical protein